MGQVDGSISLSGSTPGLEQSTFITRGQRQFWTSYNAAAERAALGKDTIARGAASSWDWLTEQSEPFTNNKVAGVAVSLALVSMFTSKWVEKTRFEQYLCLGLLALYVPVKGFQAASHGFRWVRNQWNARGIKSEFTRTYTPRLTVDELSQDEANKIVKQMETDGFYLEIAAKDDGTADETIRVTEYKTGIQFELLQVGQAQVIAEATCSGRRLKALQLFQEKCLPVFQDDKATENEIDDAIRRYQAEGFIVNWHKKGADDSYRATVKIYKTDEELQTVDVTEAASRRGHIKTGLLWDTKVSMESSVSQ